MKKNLLVVIFLFGIISIGFGQKRLPDPNVLVFNGKKIALESNVKQLKQSMVAQVNKGNRAVKGYYIIQFSEIPTQEVRATFAKKGIRLIDYLSNGAYFANLDVSTALAEASSINVRSIVEIRPDYKIAAAFDNEIPDYARASKGLVKVVVSFYNDVEKETVEQDLSAFSNEKYAYDHQFKQAYLSVKQTALLDLASIPSVQSVNLIDPPMVLENKEGRNVHKANILSSTIPGLGYGLTGKGVTVGLWDADVENHRDFNGRVSNKEFEMHTTDHGTHTCGTIAGAGLLDPKTKGMAPEAKVIAWNFNYQSNGLNNAQEKYSSLLNDGIEVTSNSFGSNISSCPNPYAYNSSDKNDDLLANYFPYFLYVYSCGNNQTACPDGYSTTSKNMKNSLMVAAIDRENNMSDFSSFGPSYDGRLIPNISGDGVDVYSTFFNNGYGYMSGTSMATPGVAGTMALLYQRFKETHGGSQPYSSFMRALACNTATDLGNPGPDFKYGYGAINGARAVKVMEKDQYYIAEVAQGETNTANITVPAGAVGLKVMLAWTDVPGTPGASQILVNDLDLSVVKDGVITLPWVLDPENPSANAVRDYDGLNNMEQVTIDNPSAGTYTIKVNGSTIPGDPQDFAVVYEVIMPTLSLTYPIGGETLAPKDEEVIHWDCIGYNKPVILEYSKDGGQTYSVIASGLSSNSNSFVWTVPDDVTANAKIRVSCGSVFDVNKKVFAIMPVPQNVAISPAECSGSGPFTMNWDAIANAKYEVLKLKGQVYEHLADVTTNTYNITGLTKSNDNYFCVKAIDLTTGAVSERSLAVTVDPTIAIAALPYKETFESQSAPNFSFAGKKGSGAVRYANDDQKYAIRLEGPTTSTGWVNATDVACFTSNPDYVVKASLCNINASAYAGKNLRLRFDYRQKYRTAAGTSYFRVKVNGNYLTNSDGTQIYGSANQISYTTVNYDLTAYAGQPSLTLEFEAVCKTNYTIYVNTNGNYDFSNDANDKGDFVNIDNVEIFEPSTDLALTSLTAETGITNSETISVTVKNNSGVAIKNIPVSYAINDGNVLTEQITEPIAPLASVTYSFLQKADFSTEGKYVVTASVNLKTDNVATNNTLSATIYSDPNSVKIGVVASPYTSCSAVFTDNAGKFADYDINQSSILTFKPDAAGKNAQVVFTEFDTEEDYDYLYIYDGPSTSSTLLGIYHGTNLPPVLTSSAIGGELTFEFTSDEAINGKGWIANISCVDKPTIDALVSTITLPTTSGVKTSTETVKISVQNAGSTDLTNIPVYYQINSGTKVSETISSLTAGQSLAYTFTSLADLSVAGTYILKAGVEVAGDVNTVNDTRSSTITNSGLVTDAGVTAIQDIIPYRAKLSPIKVTIKNLGTEAISGFPVAYKINNGAEVVETYTETIEAGSTSSYIFTTLADFKTLNTSYSVEAYTKLPNDADATNDKKTASVVTPEIVSSKLFCNYVTGNSILTGSIANQFSLTKNFTVEMWINPVENPKYGTFFSKGFSIIHHSEYYPAAYGSNCLIVSIGGQVFLTPSNSIKNNTWQHVALTSGTDGTIKVYIDGNEVELSNSAKVTQSANLATPVRIGSNSSYSQPYFGAIDDVRIWNSCLSQTDIQNNSMTDFAAGTTGLYAYYKITEKSGKYVYDYSANDNTAIALNGDVSSIGSDYFRNDEPGNLLTSFSIENEVSPTVYDEATKSFVAKVPAGTNLTALKASFTTSQKSIVKVGNTVLASGVTVKDYSSPVSLTVEGVGFNAGISQTYTVTVQYPKSTACDLTAFGFNASDNSGLANSIDIPVTGSEMHQKLPFGTTISALKASFVVSPKATLLIDGVAQANPQAIAINYSKPLLLTVMAEDGLTMKNYSIDLDARNSEANLTKFAILDEQVGETVIDAANHSITVYTKKNTDLSYLISSFTISENALLLNGSVMQENKITANDYSSPVSFTVLSEDESTSVNWTVTAIKDTEQPVITLNGASEITLEIGASYTDAGATATDNISGDLTASITSNSNVVKTSILGTYIINYNVTDEAGNMALQVTRKVTVIKHSQTIAMNAINAVYGDADLNPATATSSLAISYTSDNTDVAEIVNGKIHIKAAGSAIITASQTGNGEYYEAAPVIKVLNVAKAVLTVKANNASRIYGEANPGFTTTISGYVNADDAQVVTGTAGLTADVKANSPVGNYSIEAKIGDLAAANYSFRFEPGTLSITPATLTVTANNQSRKYGETNPEFTFLVSGIKNGEDYTKVTDAPIVFGTTATPSSAAGEYAIKAVSNATSANYTITSIDGKLTVNKAELIVKAENKTKVYSQPNPVLTSVITGYVLGDNATKISGTPGLSTTAVQNSDVNTYPIAVNISGLTSDYYYFTAIEGTLTITKDNQEITFGAVPVLYAGEADYTLNATTNKAMDITYTSSNTNIATIVNGKIHPVANGKCTITATQAGNNNYIAATQIQQEVTVVSVPGIQASAIALTNLLKDKITVSLTKGNGEQRVVFVGLDNASETVLPSAGKTYTANTEFGKGTSLNNVWYCVYNGIGNSVSITGLTDATAYKVVAYEYNGTPSTERYNTTITANANIKTASTCALPKGGSIAVDMKVCQNTSGTLSVSNVSNPGSYIWTLPAGITGTSTSNTIKISVGPAINGLAIITVQAQNTCGLGAKITQEVNVKAVETVKVGEKWDDVLICYNTENKYSAYQWYKDEVAIPNAKEQYYTTNKIAGTYYVVVTDKNECPVRSKDMIIHANVSISVSPNPVVDWLSVNYFNEVKGETVVSLYDLNGKLVLREKYEKSDEQLAIKLNATNLGVGIYTVELVLNGNIKEQVKVIKPAN
jgi:hypothetical protein